MTKRGRALIVNADDFGLTAGVNAGVVGAYRRGIVRSASLLVTTPGFADAVTLARETPELDLGVHLSLTGARSVLPPDQIPHLVGPEGRFPTLAVWQMRVLTGRLPASEVRAELAAQLARARATGLRFSHLDGHHHIHLFAPVAAVVADLAREAGIPVVRRVRDRLATMREGRSMKRRWLEDADRRWGGVYGGMVRPDAFRGLPFPSSLAAWRDLLVGLPDGVTELMCHPGLADAAVRDYDGLVAGRETELRWLCDRRVHELVAATGVTLTNFAALAAARGSC